MGPVEQLGNSWSSKPEHKSRLTCVSSESRLPWEISGNIWLFHPHAPHDAISVAHNTAHVLSCTQTHVEHISVANGQWDLTKYQLERDSLSKVTEPNSEALTQVGLVHLWLPGCVALGRISIKEQEVWSCDFPLFSRRNWFVCDYRILQHRSMTVGYSPFSKDNIEIWTTVIVRLSNNHHNQHFVGWNKAVQLSLLSC